MAAPAIVPSSPLAAWSLSSWLQPSQPETAPVAAERSIPSFTPVFPAGPAPRTSEPRFTAAFAAPAFAPVAIAPSLPATPAAALDITPRTDAFLRAVRGFELALQLEPAVAAFSRAAEAPVTAAAPVAERALPARSPQVVYLAPPARTAPSPTFAGDVVAPSLAAPYAVSYQPGAAMLRAEQLTAAIELRAAQSWGERVLTVAQAAPSLAPVAGVPERRSPEVVWVAPAERAPQSLPTSAARPARQEATGLAAVAEFLAERIGVQTLQAVAPRPAQEMAPAAASPSSGGDVAIAWANLLVRAAQSREPIVAPSLQAELGRPSAAAARAPQATVVAPFTPVAASRPELPTAVAAAGQVAVRSEQLASWLGTRAASLSTEFVDPVVLATIASGPSPVHPVYVSPAAGRAPEAGQAAAPSPGSAVESRPAAVFGGNWSLSAEEWAVAATFRSEATAMQLGGARMATAWPAPLVAPRPASTSLSAWLQPEQRVAAPAPQRAFSFAPTWLLSAQRAEAPAARQPVAMSASPTVAGEFRPMSLARSPELAWSQPMQMSTTAYASALDRPLVSPTTVPAADRTALPTGARPRGSFTWPRGTVTQAAVYADAARAFDMPVVQGEQLEQAAKAVIDGAPLWNALPRPIISGVQPAQPTAGVAASPSMPAVQTAAAVAGAAARRPVQELLTAPPAGAAGEAREHQLASARPFLEVIRGGAPSAAATAAPVLAAATYNAAAAPAQSSSPSSDSAAHLVEAVRKQSSHSDGRISLGDLTLIAFASATQQVAASAEGGGPSGGGGGGHGGGGHGGGGGGGKGGGKGPDIVALAHKVYDELQHLLEIQRERSGDPWES
jgi:hypothetical protein